MIAFEFEGVTYKVARDVGYNTEFISLPDGRVLKASYNGCFEPPLPSVFEVIHIEKAAKCSEPAQPGDFV